MTTKRLPRIVSFLFILVISSKAQAPEERAKIGQAYHAQNLPLS